MRNLRCLATVLILASTLAVNAKDALADTVPTDNVARSGGLKRLIDRVIDYFDDSNKPHAEKDFDMSFIGGPHYSSDTKFGIGLVGAGLYRTDRSDSLLPPSEISLKLDATTSGYFSASLTGVNISARDRIRLNYKADFYYIRTKFWGIGYDECSNNDNETPYRYFRSMIRIDFQGRIGGHIYLGPEVGVDYTHGYDITRPELWDYQKERMFNLGLGIKLSYDTRDNLTYTHCGVLLSFAQRFYPRFFGNGDYNFNLTELTAACYHPLWRGATLADRLHARLTYGNTPWGLMSTIGGSEVMRGYFEGRYRDKSEIDLTVELRQHVWRRNSLVAWVGLASVFSDTKQITARRLLPNVGVGYRWEFKKDVNVRIDLGFGRGECGFILNINEAF